MPDDTNSPHDQFDRPGLAPYLGSNEGVADTSFNEDAYLRAYPDVAEAVERGDLKSALEHYRIAGHAEQRLQRPEYFRQLAQTRAAPTVTIGPPPRAEIDNFVVSETGAVFLTGWTDDRQNALGTISVASGRGARCSWTGFPRRRRADVEAMMPSGVRHHYGFWAFAGPEDIRRRHGIAPEFDCRIELRFGNGAVADIQRKAAVATNSDLRDTVMTYIAASEYWGNRLVQAFSGLDLNIGEALAEFGRTVSRPITACANAERFGPRRRRYKGSIIVPLYGNGDGFFLQSCANAGGPGIEDYEFIYVINNPEQIERLCREARIGQSAYGLAQTFVLLPGNVGVAAANNVAVQFAQSDRLIYLNQDVFPQDRAWARHHSELLGNLPAQQTQLFGTTLCYGDGSLMHGGMYFEADNGLHATPTGFSRRNVLRVEHYGRGAPPSASLFTTPRPVPAVSGAFMSVDRAWFEQLGGFAEDYVFGGYEDADLCLKSLQRGVPAWLHDIRMWHLEGKGLRRLPPHEGGLLLNQWLFTHRWEQEVARDLVGRTPRHAAIAGGGIARPSAAPRPPPPKAPSGPPPKAPPGPPPRAPSSTGRSASPRGRR